MDRPHSIILEYEIPMDVKYSGVNRVSKSGRLLYLGNYKPTAASRDKLQPISEGKLEESP